MPYFHIWVFTGLPSKQDSPQTVEAFVGTLVSLPPEIGRTFYRGFAVRSRSEKPQAELAEQAFDAADGAGFRLGERLRRELGFRVDLHGSAWEQYLDAVSLKARAVDALIALDRKKGLGLFEELAPPLLVSTACSSDWVPDVAEYYRVLGRVLVSQAQPNDLSSVMIAQRAVREAPTTPDIVGLLRVVTLTDVSQDQFLYLFGAAADELARAGSDPSGFRLLAPDLLRLIAGAMFAASQRGISNGPMLSAARSFLVRQTHDTASCVSPGVPNGLSGSLELIARSYNGEIAQFRYPEQLPVEPITVSELTPQKTEYAGQGRTIWQLENGAATLSAVKHVREVLASDINGDEKAAVALGALSLIDEWTPSLAGAEALFNAKAILYRALLTDAGGTAAASQIFERYAEYMREEDGLIPAAVWFLHAKELLAESDRSRQVIVGRDPILRAYQSLAEIDRMRN